MQDLKDWTENAIDRLKSRYVLKINHVLETLDWLEIS